MKKKKIFLIMALTGAFVGLSSCNIKSKTDVTTSSDVISTEEETESSLSNDEIASIFANFNSKDYNYSSINITCYDNSASKSYVLEFAKICDAWELLNDSKEVLIDVESVENITKLKKLNVEYKVSKDSNDKYIVKFNLDGISYEYTFNKDGYIESGIKENLNSNNFLYDKIEFSIQFDNKEFYNQANFKDYLDNLERANYNKCKATYSDGKVLDLALNPIWTADGSVYEYSKYFYINDVEDIRNKDALFYNNNYLVIIENNLEKEELLYDESGYLKNYKKIVAGTKTVDINFVFKYEELKSSVIDLEAIEKEINDNRKDVWYAFEEKQGDVVVNCYYDFLKNVYYSEGMDFNLESSMSLLSFLKEIMKAENLSYTLEKDSNNRYVLKSFEYYPENNYISTSAVYFNSDYYASECVINTSNLSGIEYGYCFDVLINKIENVVSEDLYKRYYNQLEDIYYNVVTISSKDESITLKKDLVWDATSFDGFNLDYLHLKDAISIDSYDSNNLEFIYDGLFTLRVRKSQNDYELYSYDMNGYLVKYQSYKANELVSSYEIEFDTEQKITKVYDFDAIRNEIATNRKKCYYAADVSIDENINGKEKKYTEKWEYDFYKNTWKNELGSFDSIFELEHWLSNIEGYTNVYYEIIKDEKTGLYTIIISFEDDNNIIKKSVLNFDSNYYLYNYVDCYGNKYYNHLDSKREFTFEFTDRIVTEAEFNEYYKSISNEGYDTCKYFITEKSNGEKSEFINYKHCLWDESEKYNVSSKALLLPHLFKSSVINDPDYKVTYEDGYIVIQALNDDTIYKYDFLHPGYLVYCSNSTYEIEFSYSNSFDSITKYNQDTVLADIENRKKSEEALVFDYNNGKTNKSAYYEKDSNLKWNTSENVEISFITEIIDLENTFDYIKNMSNLIYYITKEDGKYALYFMTKDIQSEGYIKAVYNNNYYLESIIYKVSSDFETYIVNVSGNLAYCNKIATASAIEMFINSLQKQDFNHVNISDGISTYTFVKNMIWEINVAIPAADPEIFFFKTFYDSSMLTNSNISITVEGNIYHVNIKTDDSEIEYVYDDLGYIKECKIYDLKLKTESTYSYEFYYLPYELNVNEVMSIVESGTDAHKNEIYKSAKLSVYESDGTLLESETVNYVSEKGWSIPIIYFEDFCQQFSKEDIKKFTVYKDYFVVQIYGGDDIYLEYVFNNESYLTSATSYTIDKYDKKRTLSQYGQVTYSK